MPNDAPYPPDPKDPNLQELARIAGLSPDELAKRITKAPAMKEGEVTVTDASAPNGKCADFSVHSYGVPFTGKLCAALKGHNLDYTINLKIYGDTANDAGGLLSKDHDSASFPSAVGPIKGVLRIEMDDWSSHCCPVVSWSGTINLGKHSPRIEWSKKVFCLR